MRAGPGRSSSVSGVPGGLGEAIQNSTGEVSERWPVFSVHETSL